MGIKEKELDYLNEKAHKHDVYGPLINHLRLL